MDWWAFGAFMVAGIIVVYRLDALKAKIEELEKKIGEQHERR